MKKGRIAIRYLFFIFLTIFCKSIVGQAPGNVSSNLSLWLKTDAGTSTTLDNTEINSWVDQSGTGNSVFQSSAGKQPVFKDNFTDNVNYNPIILFDGVDDFMEDATGILGTGVYANANVYSVSSTETLLRSMLIFETCTPDRFGIHPPWNNGDYHWDAGSTANGSEYRLVTDWGGTVGTPYLFSALYSTTSGQTISGTRQTIRRDGTTIGSDNTALSFTGTDSPFYLSARDGNTFYNHSRYAEVIIYLGAITADENNKIESYLSMKYGITKEGDYLSSTSTTVWDATINSTYHNNVTAIGRDDNSTLDQQKSLSINSTAALIIDNTTSFDVDREFLVVGSNGLTGLNTSDKPLEYKSISSRVWRSEEEGTVSGLTLRFLLTQMGLTNTGNADDYALYYNDTDTDFSSGASFSRSGTLNGDTLTFTNIDLNDGYFVIATPKRPAPGGVIFDLALWLRGDAGTSTTTDENPVSLWNDQSPYNNDMSQSTSALQPIYKDNVEDNINNNQVIDFDEHRLSDASGVLGGSTYSDLNVYSVHITDEIRKSVVFQEDCSPSRILIHSPWTDNRTYFDGGHSMGGDRIRQDWGGEIGTPYLWTNLHSTTSGQTITGSNQSIHRDGIQLISDQDANTYTGTNSPMHIGDNGTGLSYFNAKYGEFVLYNGPITEDENNKIESYLAIKYGITKEGDYYLSNGIMCWNSSLYHNDVVGIARDDNSLSYQKQSHTPDDSLRVFLSAYEGSNSDNSGIITNDLSSIMIGHDKEMLQGLLVPSSSVPSGIYNKLERTWQVTNTNFVDDFNLEIEWDSLGTFDLDDIRLLVDDDGDFSNADVFGVASGLSFSLGSIIIEGIDLSHIPMNSTRFVTIGSVSIGTPLPIELLDFTVKSDDDKVDIVWHTATEINNDFFSIQRSLDGKIWETIEVIDGAGHSSTILGYQTSDPSPFEGTSYYRLKQTDFDGEKSYSLTRSVFVSKKKSRLFIYPNPTQNTVTVEGNSNELEHLLIYNVYGQDLTNDVIILIDEVGKKVFDLSKLEAGVYLFLTDKGTYRVNKI